MIGDHRYVSQTYPLWCAEVDLDAKTINTSRVIAWWVNTSDSQADGELVPVLARTDGGDPQRQVKQVTCAEFGQIDSPNVRLFLAESFDTAHDDAWQWFRKQDSGKEAR